MSKRSLLISNAKESADEYILSRLSLDMALYEKLVGVKHGANIYSVMDSADIQSRAYNVLIKASDRGYRESVVKFVGEMTANRLPENTFYDNRDIGSDIEAEHFHLRMYGERFLGDIFCLGRDGCGNFYIISPDFEGVRCVCSESGVIKWACLNSIDEFAYVAMKYSMLERAFLQGVLDKSSLIDLLKTLQSDVLKRLVDNLLQQ
jgi:hypothetical protein